VTYWLVMKNSDGSERPFPIHNERTVIGREDQSHVRVPIPTVAPRHCEIILRGEELRLADLGSPHGTLHNGAPVREAILNERDELTVGPVTFEVRRAVEGADRVLTEVRSLPGVQGAPVTRIAR
jgi:pSer/pThr/pTyr-binding forkhead associated (FHA) protein